jgi:hypothetical protein
VFTWSHRLRGLGGEHVDTQHVVSKHGSAFRGVEGPAAEPPTVIVSVLFALGVTIPDAIQVTLWVGAASLGLWGWLAGKRAGYRGWRLVVAAGAGLIVGLVVLTIHIVLEPGPNH